MFRHVTNEHAARKTPPGSRARDSVKQRQGFAIIMTEMPNENRLRCEFDKRNTKNTIDKIRCRLWIQDVKAFHWAKNQRGQYEDGREWRGKHVRFDISKIPILSEKRLLVVKR